jgi:hypothetical protein
MRILGSSLLARAALFALASAGVETAQYPGYTNGASPRQPPQPRSIRNTTSRKTYSGLISRKLGTGNSHKQNVRIQSKSKRK